MKTIWQSFQTQRRSIRPLDRARAQEALSCYSFMDGAGEIGSDVLLKELGESYAAARAFAESPHFAQALERLGQAKWRWDSAQMMPNRCRLLVANCSLAALSLIADANIKGWDLVVEDCAFSRRFIAPVQSRGPGRIEFQPTHLLLRRQGEIAQSENHRSALFVTFCDRPMGTVGDCIDTKIAGNRYHLSILDALLIGAATEAIFVLGAGLRHIVVADRADWSTGRISGETLLHYTTLCSTALSEMIAAAPGQYLGTAQLVTRGTKYRITADKSKKALVKSLLHYCQVSGMAISQTSYRQLLLKLEAPSNNHKAVPA